MASKKELQEENKQLKSYLDLDTIQLNELLYEIKELKSEEYDDKQSLEILEAIHKKANSVDRIVETITRQRANEKYEILERQFVFSTFLLLLVFITVFSILMCGLFRG